MSVNYRENIGALLVNAEMHLDLGGRIELTLQLVSVAVDSDDHIGGKVTLGHTCRCAVEFVVAYLNRNVTVVCCDKALRIKLVTYFADFLFDFKC